MKFRDVLNWGSHILKWFNRKAGYLINSAAVAAFLNHIGDADAPKQRYRSLCC